MVAVVSSYFAFFFRLIMLVYCRKRARGTKKVQELQITKQKINELGFKHLGRNVADNDVLIAMSIRGEVQEFLQVNYTKSVGIQFVT